MPTEKIKNVRVERGPKNLSSNTFATTDIYRIQPVFCRETKKNDIFDIEHKQINICDALSVPSFVSVKSRNSWFYVPFSKVWQPFESVLGSTHISMNNVLGNPYKFNKVPSFNMLHVISAFDQLGWLSISPTRPNSYDFRWNASNGVPVFCILSHKGRIVWSILQGLGYRFSMFFTNDSNANIVLSKIGPSPSALPLFAYTKIFCENFIPSKYADKANILVSKIYNFATDFSIGTSVGYVRSNSSPSVQELCIPDSLNLGSVGFLADIFNTLSSVYYGDDYFTSSPVDAMASDDNLNDSANIFDISKPAINSGAYSTYVSIDSSNNYTPVHKGASNGGSPSNSPYNVSEYIHNMLRILTKNIQLKALAGSKLSQRLYALYGSKSQTYNMEAVLLDQDVSEIDVKAITSMADTSSANGGADLGYKGGQMNNYNGNKYHYEFSEFGVLICINQVIPTYFYGQGLHREMMHVKPEDFYNDRFALAGYQNIGRFELFNDDYLGYYHKTNAPNPTDTWGKTSAYAEYALRKDCIMGDFSLLSRQLGLDEFHFNRFLVDQQDDMVNNRPIVALDQLPNNNEYFMQVANFPNSPSLGAINHQFDRIFTVSNSTEDHIAQWNEYIITAVRDGRNINDFTIGDENGSDVELQGLGKVLYH